MSQAFVQAAINSGVLNSQATAYGGSVTAGNILCVICELQGASTTCTSMSIADTNLNTWTPIWGSIQSPAGGAVATFIQGWFCVNNTTSASNIVTVTTNGGSIGQNVVAIGEFSGFSGATMDTGANAFLTAAAANAAAILGLSFTTTLPNAIIFGFTVINASQSSVNATVNTPFALDSLAPPVSLNNLVVHALAPTTGSYALSGTWPVNGGNSRVSAGFTIASGTFSISGSAGIAGATVAWSGTSSGSTTADGSGNYTISGLSNGSYTITPSLTGYTFSPTSSNQTVSGGNITGVNFVATQQTVVTPTFSPVAGSYTGTQSVAISTTTPSSSIFYTTDGSTPTTGSTPYSGPVTVSVSLTLKAIATSSGFINSAVGSAAYVIGTAAHYSVSDSRNYGNFPNLSVTVNGTKTYTVPSVYSLKYWFDVLFNRTQPLPEDSRAAGKPVASGTYPQNSRAPGVNGPNN